MIRLASPSDGSRTIGSRLAEARSTLGLSIDGVSQRTGVPASTIKKWEGEQRSPGGDQLSKLATLGINLDWVLTGRGSMLLDDAAAESTEDATADFVTIPRYGIEVSAGSGRAAGAEGVEERLAFRNDWISKDVGVATRHLVLVTARGDSMEPTLSDGDTLLVDRSRDRVDVDGVYVVRIDGDLFAKRVQKHGGPGRLMITSDNPLYDSFWIDLNRMPDIAIIGRVVWAGHRF